MKLEDEDKKALKAYYEDLVKEGLIDMSFRDFLSHINKSDWIFCFKDAELDNSWDE